MQAFFSYGLLLFPYAGLIAWPGIEPKSPALEGVFLTTWPPGKFLFLTSLFSSFEISTWPWSSNFWLFSPSLQTSFSGKLSQLHLPNFLLILFVSAAVFWLFLLHSTLFLGCFFLFFSYFSEENVVLQFSSAFCFVFLSSKFLFFSFHPSFFFLIVLLLSFISSPPLQYFSDFLINMNRQPRIDRFLRKLTCNCRLVDLRNGGDWWRAGLLLGSSKC